MGGLWQGASSFIRRFPGRSCLCAGLLLAALFMPAPAGGGVADADPSASAFIRAFSAESLRELTDPAMPAAKRETRFRRLLTQHFDLAAMSKFVLGRYWRKATEEQRSAFRQAHEDFIVHSYAARFADYQSVGFQVVGSAAAAGGIIVVHSRVRTSRTKEVFLDWHLRAAGDSFLIVDLIVEGVSMAVTQRSDFGSIAQNHGGVDGLIAALRTKNAEPAGDGTKP